jgi:hypothetical protein
MKTLCTKVAFCYFWCRIFFELKKVLGFDERFVGGTPSLCMINTWFLSWRRYKEVTLFFRAIILFSQTLDDTFHDD